MTNPPIGLDDQLSRQTPTARRPRAWLGIVAILTLIAFAALFDRLPALLITEEQWNHADCVLVLGGGDCLAEAARRYHAGRAERLLFVGRTPEPVVQLKIIPRFEELGRRWLLKAGVPPHAIELIPADAHNSWETTCAFAQWLAAHPGAKIDVLSDRLLSSRDRFELHSVLAPEQAVWVRVFGLPDPRIVERGWWRHRIALKSLATACLTFAFDYYHGPPPAGMLPSAPVTYAGVLE